MLTMVCAKALSKGNKACSWGLECGYEDDDQLESLGHHR